MAQVQRVFTRRIGGVVVRLLLTSLWKLAVPSQSEEGITYAIQDGACPTPIATLSDNRTPS